MNLRKLAIISCLITVPAFAAGTVTVDLTSPVDGAINVAPGDIIPWTITAAVSSGDNQGLALIAVDFVQSGSNPECIEIPYADLPDTPANGGLSDFSRPEGISNPGQGGNSTGFIGTQIGDPGCKNLIQIGGAQNTFGQAGSTMGFDVDVRAGVGQSGAVVVATGSFMAPATPGTYEFSIENVIANTLDAVNPAPDFSPVGAATILSNDSLLTFTVVAPSCPADLTGDNVVDASDLNIILSNWNCPNPGSDCQGADLTGDGNVDASDLNVVLSAWGPCP